jgi:poly(3-hydroxyalkanoate) synthetase
MINPPDNPKASFRFNPELPEDSDAWLAGAATTPGSWWEDWTAWMAERSGSERPAPKKLGAKGRRPLARAPGTYVKE